MLFRSTIFHISADETVEATIGASSRMGLRMCMTLIPIAVLIVGLVVFWKNYILTDEKLEEINGQLRAKRGQEK